MSLLVGWRRRRRRRLFPLISTFSAGMKKNLLHFFLFFASRSSTAANEQKRCYRAIECVKNASRLHEKLQTLSKSKKKDTKATMVG